LPRALRIPAALAFAAWVTYILFAIVFSGGHTAQMPTDTTTTSTVVSTTTAPTSDGETPAVDPAHGESEGASNVPLALSLRVAQFEEAVHSIKPSDSRASVVARLVQYAPNKKVADRVSSDLLDGSEADKARIRQKLTISGVAKTELMQAQQTGQGTYEILVPVDISITNPQGSVVNKLSELHTSIWRKNKAGEWVVLRHSKAS
jgi:hypothetical protein